MLTLRACPFAGQAVTLNLQAHHFYDGVVSFLHATAQPSCMLPTVQGAAAPSHPPIFASEWARPEDESSQALRLQSSISFSGGTGVASPVLVHVPESAIGSGEMLEAPLPNDATMVMRINRDHAIDYFSVDVPVEQLYAFVGGKEAQRLAAESVHAAEIRDQLASIGPARFRRAKRRAKRQFKRKFGSGSSSSKPKVPGKSSGKKKGLSYYTGKKRSSSKSKSSKTPSVSGKGKRSSSSRSRSKSSRRSSRRSSRKGTPATPGGAQAGGGGGLPEYRLSSKPDGRIQVTQVAPSQKAAAAGGGPSKSERGRRRSRERSKSSRDKDSSKSRRDSSKSKSGRDKDRSKRRSSRDKDSSKRRSSRDKRKSKDAREKKQPREREPSGSAAAASSSAGAGGGAAAAQGAPAEAQQQQQQRDEAAAGQGGGGMGMGQGAPAQGMPPPQTQDPYAQGYGQGMYGGGPMYFPQGGGYATPGYVPAQQTSYGQQAPAPERPPVVQNVFLVSKDLPRQPPDALTPAGGGPAAAAAAGGGGEEEGGAAGGGELPKQSRIGAVRHIQNHRSTAHVATHPPGTFVLRPLHLHDNDDDSSSSDTFSSASSSSSSSSHIPVHSAASAAAAAAGPVTTATSAAAAAAAAHGHNSDTDSDSDFSASSDSDTSSYSDTSSSSSSSTESSDSGDSGDERDMAAVHSDILDALGPLLHAIMEAIDPSAHGNLLALGHNIGAAQSYDTDHLLRDTVDAIVAAERAGVSSRQVY